MQPVQYDLHNRLLKQNFVSETQQQQLQQCQIMAQNFVELENGIAILSDLKNNKSYIYSGKIADELNIFQSQNNQEIEGIWEDELFNILNPEDVLQKHILELQFFQMIRTVEPDRRKDFCITSRLRLAGSQKSLIHKMFYFSDAYHQNVELALCFYHFDFLPSLDSTGMIINTAEGSIIRQAEVDNSNFLSAREKEILKMIQLGKRSKEIADALFISINTVNRHRQNILEKMRVSNTTEACTLAAKLRWI